MVFFSYERVMVLLGQMLRDVPALDPKDTERFLLDLMNEPSYRTAVQQILSLEVHAQRFGELPAFAKMAIATVNATCMRNFEFRVKVFKSPERFEERHVLYFVRHMEVEKKSWFDYLLPPMRTLYYPLALWTQDGMPISPSRCAESNRFLR